MKRVPWLVLLVLLPAAFLVGRIMPSGHGEGADDSVNEAARETRWTCSMHPQIILPTNDQKCPICFMDLIPLEEEVGGLGPRDLALSPEAAALADIETMPVERSFVSRRVSLVGKVAVDDNRLRKVTAWYAGRLDRLHVSTRGVAVRAGQPLAEIYSPDLYSAQVELQSAARTGSSSLIASARNKLRLLGLSDEGIAEVEAGGAPREHITITAEQAGIIMEQLAVEGQYVGKGSILYTVADLSRVWLTLEAFERDLAWLKEGQPVRFTTRNLPGKSFSGEIVFIDPVLDERTRTCEVRVEVANPDGVLKPGLLVQAYVDAVLAEGGRPVAGDEVAEPPLVIPDTAPLLTGRRAVVYVKLPDTEEPVFQGRTVTLGPRADHHYLVADGLREGEEVVTRGAFKIDSALQIQARQSMMLGEETPPEENETVQARLSVPAAFRQDLGAFVSAYADLQKALADDDAAGSQTAVAELARRFAALEKGRPDLPVATNRAWAEYHDTLSPVVARIERASDLETRRVPFQPLSDALWLIVQDFDPESDVPLRRFHCPMAFGNEGANWIQKDELIANPYFGEMMLRCGTEVSVHE